MSRNIKNKVTGSLSTITTYDPATGAITGFSPIGNVNLGPVANVHIDGGSNGQVLSTDGAGNLSWVASGSGDSIGNGTTSVSIPTSDGAIFANVGGATKMAITASEMVLTANLIPTGAAVYGLGNATNPWKDLYLSGNTLYIANVPVSVSGNTLTVAGNSLLTANTPISGNVSVTGTVSGANGQFTGNIIANNATVNANMIVANLTATRSTLGNVGNVRITGGSNGQFLRTDGNGNLSWANASGGGGTPGGANTQVQFNDGGNFNGVAGFTFNKLTNTFSAPLIVGTIATPAQPNITSLGTLTGLISTGGVNFTGASNVSLGAVGNVRITGGTNGQYLRTDGTGNLSWFSASTDRISNGTTSFSIPTANGNIIANVGGNLTTISNTGIVTNQTVNANSVIANNITLNNSVIKLGSGAGQTTPGADFVAIGANALGEGSGNRAIAIGLLAGYYGANVTGDDTIAIGANAGAYDQNSNAIAIGADSATYRQGDGAIAIGKFAAMGSNPDANSAQQTGAVAIGSRAGSLGQGQFSIAVGANAGRDVAGGTNQNNNSIVLNATGLDLNAPTANTFIVKPIRSADAPAVMFYDSVTGEITQSGTGNVLAGNVYANAGTIQGNSVVALANVNAGNVIATSNIQAVSANFTGNSNVANLGANYIRVGNALVTGNLTVQGNLVTTNQTSLEVEDPIISLGVQANDKPYSSNDGVDRGLIMHTYGDTFVTVVADSRNNNEIQLANIAPNTIVGQQFWANLANGAPLFTAGTTVTAYDEPNLWVTLSTNWLQPPVANNEVIIGRDNLEFQGYLNGSNTFVVASNVTNNNNIITVVEYGNFQANSITVANVTANGNVVASANITANNTVFGVSGNFTGNVIAANLTANVGVVSPNANITTLLTALDANVTGNLVVTGNTTTKDINTTTGNITTVNVTASGNVQAQNVTALGDATVSGNANIGNLLVNGVANIGNVANIVILGGSNGQFLQTDGNGNVAWETISTSQIANGNSNVTIPTVDGPVYVNSNNVLAATFTDTGLTLGANLVVSGTANITGNFNMVSNGVANLGNVANVKITGGNSGQFLRTDGNGNLTWSGGGSGTPGGANYTVQWNDDGAFGGSAEFQWNPGTANLDVVGNIQGSTVLTGANLPAGPNVAVTGIVKTMPYYIADGDTDWFLPDQTGNLYQTVTVDGAYIIDGTLYDYWDANGNTEFQGNVEVIGNLSVTGSINLSGVSAANITSTNLITANNVTITGNLTRSRWNSGEVIKTIALQQSGFNQNSSVLVGGAGAVQLGNYVYQPVSNNSRIYIRYTTNYSLTSPSVSTSRWMGIVRINGSDFQRREQDFIPYALSGSVYSTASSTAFPIEAVYNQTTGASVTIAMVMQRITGDNSATVNNDSTYPATLYIQEIQN